MASSSAYSSALLPGPATTDSGLVGSPRRDQYPAAAARSSGEPATGPYPPRQAAAASSSRSNGSTGRPASPKPKGRTGWPACRLAASASLTARVADTGMHAAESLSGAGGAGANPAGGATSGGAGSTGTWVEAADRVRGNGDGLGPAQGMAMGSLLRGRRSIAVLSQRASGRTLA